MWEFNGAENLWFRVQCLDQGFHKCSLLHSTSWKRSLFQRKHLLGNRIEWHLFHGIIHYYRENLDRNYTARGLHKSLLWTNISLLKWMPWASGFNTQGRQTWLYAHVEVNWRPRRCRMVWSPWYRKPIMQYILLGCRKQQVGNDGWWGG